MPWSDDDESSSSHSDSERDSETGGENSKVILFMSSLVECGLMLILATCMKLCYRVSYRGLKPVPQPELVLICNIVPDHHAVADTNRSKSRKLKSGAIDFEALKRHGYRGGPSVLKVPPPKEDDSKQDWTWSTGREKRVEKEIEESYEERQKTREAVSLGEELPAAMTRSEKKNLSFSQKEKRKRELGQASRGKNYVEEEKRLLRESGIYSGFDA
ncbi:hypothetical protein Fmac_027905 [Flemingia macrophylla]|uniref:Uncharacterized protein n=1 Tax=Flemingia macrophylla TaxID=520843 RepID=A0ABD1LJ83_9FABA